MPTRFTFTMPATTCPPAALFDRIALSLSGGGFRAAAYSLGTLKALYLLGLLDNVHLLSTASGGTIAGAYYALRRKRGDALPTIYHDFYRFLEQDELLPHALARWQQTLDSPNDKLIRAFADTYSHDLYGDARFGAFWQPDADAHAPFHLQSLVFGATELYSGLTFRFQYAAFLPAPKGGSQGNYRIGNGTVWLKTKHAQALRLGDVVAASACFPGGFEPLVMPDDFFPEPPPKVLRGSSQRVPERIALLDGGIYDNQGIESLLLANARNAKYAAAAQHTHTPQQAALLQPSTLYLVADVSGADRNLYVPPATAQRRYSPTLGQAWGLGVLALGVGLLLSWGLARLANQPFLAGMLAGIGLVGAAVLLLAWRAWRGIGRQLQRIGAQVSQWLLPRLAQLSWQQWRELLRLRLGSVFALLTAVFMRRVRSLTYERLYRQFDLAPLPPSYAIVSSSVGRIVTEYERWKSRGEPPQTPPRLADQLAVVYPTVCLAQQMPTTLWWQHEKHRLPAVVASAEITLCYLLLRRFEKDSLVPGSREAEVQRRAQLLWDAYQRGEAGFVVPVEARAVLDDPTGTVEQLMQLPTDSRPK